MTALTARADVPTEAPDRYAKQLLSHLGRRTSWTTDGATSTASISKGKKLVNAAGLPYARGGAVPSVPRHERSGGLPYQPCQAAPGSRGPRLST